MGTPQPDGGWWRLTASAIAIVVVLIAILSLLYLTSRRERRWLRGLLSAESPGMVATVVALVISVQPALATGAYQGVFVVVAVLCLVWFIASRAVTSAKEGNAEALRFAREAILYADKLFILTRDVQRLDPLGDNMHTRPVIEATFHAADTYSKTYRLELVRFLQEMAERDISDDKEALALASCMETRTLPSYEEIVDLAKALNEVALDILRAERRYS
jgi:hypothetical protein